MKKNTVYNIYSLFLLLLSLNSCQKQVLEQPYYMGFDANTQFSTPERIELAVLGLYNSLQNAEFLGGRVLIYSDIRSNDVNVPTFFGNMAIFNPLSSDVTTSNAWLGAYSTIYSCNNFIKQISTTVNLVDQDVANKYTAEARFIRGLVYFYVLNFWGQQYCLTNNNLGVPLVLKPADAVSVFNQLPERATINATYDTIIADLKYAEDNLPIKGATSYSTLARANKASARAILSRVYLYKGDNSNAVIYANKVINKMDATTSYSLVSDISTIFITTSPEKTTEPIFFIAMNANDNPNTNNSLGQHYGSSLRKDINISDTYIALLGGTTSTDTRYTKLITTVSGIRYTKKYDVTSNGSWVPVIRYAEILLNRAEATVKQNLGAATDSTALSDLNSVYKRSTGLSYAITDFPTNQDLLTAILKERQKELAFEGHGSFDKFRNKQGIPARGTEPEQVYPNDRFALPIPQSDIQQNMNLIQNNSY